MRITLSCIKADVGGFVGHGEVHPELLGRAHELLGQHILEARGQCAATAATVGKQAGANRHDRDDQDGRGHLPAPRAHDRCDLVLDDMERSIHDPPARLHLPLNLVGHSVHRVISFRKQSRHKRKTHRTRKRPEAEFAS